MINIPLRARTKIYENVLNYILYERMFLSSVEKPIFEITLGDEKPFFADVTEKRACYGVTPLEMGKKMGDGIDSLFINELPPKEPYAHRWRVKSGWYVFGNPEENSFEEYDLLEDKTGKIRETETLE